MSKHTPGPWEVLCGDDSACVHATAEISDETRGAIAQCTIDREERPIDECEANAHLIAAAPDMLAALRAIVFQTCQGTVLDRDACITQARAAIAKAEARS